jgi:hypothetical protein
MEEMNEKTLAALTDSIEHWERLATGKSKKNESIYADDCALCQVFFRGSTCEGCPVNTAGFPSCRRSVCEVCDTAVEDWQCKPHRKYKSWKDTPRFRKAARAQLKFLKSLLPKKKSKPKKKANGPGH